MRRHRPDPDQRLFKFAWHDEADDRPDAPEDDDRPPAPPPLRDRVLRLYAPAAMRELWGTPVVVRNAPGKPVARPTTIDPTEGAVPARKAPE
jgi:hypothetical protein